MKKKKVIVVLMLIVLSVIGCTKNNTGVENNTSTETQNTSTETQNTGTEVEPQEIRNGIGLTNQERMKDLILAEHEIGMPCQYGEFIKYFTLSDGHTLEEYPDFAIFPFQYNGEKVGEIWVKCSAGTDNIKDTDWIFMLCIYPIDSFDDMGMSFGFCNINEKSTMNDIINNMGEPSRKTDVSFYYYDSDLEPEAAFCVDEIMFDFGINDGTLEECTLVYNINNLEDN